MGSSAHYLSLMLGGPCGSQKRSLLKTSAGAGLTEKLPFRLANRERINRIDPFRLTGRNKAGTIAGLG
jgi:hypothetical protein